VDSLNPRAIAEVISEHSVSWMMAVPAFYEMLLIHLESRGMDLSSLRVLESGGAWVSPDTASRIENSFKCIFLPVWGSTETHGVALALLPGEERALGATGRPIRWYAIDVVDRHGQSVPMGSTGELVVSGPGVATHYFKQSLASAVHFRDGLYFTGDLVRRDEAGTVWFVGRKNDLMKVGGIRVFPLEIEQAVVEHPSVAEVSVVRANERIRGDIPRAIVCLHSGESLSPNEVKAWCRQYLAIYKVPRIVEIWPSLPRLPNGKVDRRGIEATPVGQVA
jgi:long-chain acyl-CoA synthetase